MNPRLLFTAIISLAILNCHAQFGKALIDSSIGAVKLLDIKFSKSKSITQPLAGSAGISPDGKMWNTIIRSSGNVHRLPDSIVQLKAIKTMKKIQNLEPYYPDEPSEPNLQPLIGKNFHGNSFDGWCPPDNTCAISNNGYIVSVVNSNIQYYDMDGNCHYFSSLEAFINDPSLTSKFYDPVVLYDSGSDRFFMVILHGTTHAKSKVLVCFSKSNDPNQGWWFYKLTGDPLNDYSWFDYPKIGVSNNEVYVTGNLFSDELNYRQSVIYQITKSGGYNGTYLTWTFWHNISESPFTIVPASFGQQGNYGPGIYFVATGYHHPQTDKLLLYDLTDDLSGAPELNVYGIDTDFSLAGDAPQLGSSVLLDNGDCRGLNAFYLDGILHFVFHSAFEKDYNGINYNRLNISSLTNWSSQMGLDGYDYSYPSVASFGTSLTDKSVMISFLRSGSTIYPQHRVIYCDNSGAWSNSGIIRSGETYVTASASEGVARWGDYTGISRKQNSSTPEVWVTGQFGSGSHAFETWIAEVYGVSSAIKETPKKNLIFKVYPNPTHEKINISFELSVKSNVLAEISDADGRLVKTLFNDALNPGKVELSFNQTALGKGIYIISVKADNVGVFNQKIVVE